MILSESHIIAYMVNIMYALNLSPWYFRSRDIIGMNRSHQDNLSWLRLVANARSSSV